MGLDVIVIRTCFDSTIDSFDPPPVNPTNELNDLNDQKDLKLLPITLPDGYRRDRHG